MPEEISDLFEIMPHHSFDAATEARCRGRRILRLRIAALLANTTRQLDGKVAL